MKMIILAASDNVNDEVIAKFVQELSNSLGENLPLTILDKTHTTPMPMQRNLFEQHVEDIIRVCGNEGDLTFQGTFWQNVINGRITKEVIETILNNHQDNELYLRRRKNAPLVVELCRIAKTMVL